MDPRSIRKPAPEAVAVTARTLDEAYRTVRSRFGNDAVILDTRSVTVPGRSGLGLEKAVELLVARGEETPHAAGPELPDMGDLVDRLEREIGRLESRIEEMAADQESVTVVAGNQGDGDDLVDGLVRLGASRVTAQGLATRFRAENPDGESGFDTWLAGQLECADCTWDQVEGLHAFVGPSGSGKTRLALAAAGHVAALGHRVLVLAVAPEHPGEIRRLQHAAFEGNFDAAVIRRPEQVVELAANLSEYHTVLVDLPALESPAMVNGGDLHEWVAGHHGIHRHLLVPLDLDPADLEDLPAVARKLNCDWIAAGRLDRTRRPGKLLDLVSAVPLRLSLLAGFEPARIADRDALVELFRVGDESAAGAPAPRADAFEPGAGS